MASVLAEQAAPAVPDLEHAEPAVLGLHAEHAWLELQYEPALLGMHAEPDWLGLQYEPALLSQHTESAAPAVVLSPHALLVMQRTPALHLGILPVHAHQAASVAAAVEYPADHDLAAAAGAQQGFLQGSAGVYPTPAVPDADVVPGDAVPDAAAAAAPAAAAMALQSSALHQPMDACFQAAQTAGLEQERCQKQESLLPCRREHACDRSFPTPPWHRPKQQLIVSKRAQQHDSGCPLRLQKTMSSDGGKRSSRLSIHEVHPQCFLHTIRGMLQIPHSLQIAVARVIVDAQLSLVTRCQHLTPMHHALAQQCVHNNIFDMLLSIKSPVIKLD